MGVGLETIFDLGNEDQDISITDLEKWTSLFDQMKIDYEINNEINEQATNNTKEYISLKVRSKYERDTSLYIQELEVKFNLDKSFRCIECIGD